MKDGLKLWKWKDAFPRSKTDVEKTEGSTLSLLVGKPYQKNYTQLEAPPLSDHTSAVGANDREADTDQN